MARIAGVDIPREKRVEIGLTYIFGIGRTASGEILEKTGVNPDTRVKDLTDDEVAKLREVIENDYLVEGDLRRKIAYDIKSMSDIGCYKGSVTARDFLSEDRELRPTQEHARVLQRQLQIRRNKGVTDKWQLKYRLKRLLRDVAKERILRRAQHISAPHTITQSLLLQT